MARVNPGSAVFTIDEPLEELGSRLKLPSWLERLCPAWRSASRR